MECATNADVVGSILVGLYVKPEKQYLQPI